MFFSVFFCSTLYMKALWKSTKYVRSFLPLIWGEVIWGRGHMCHCLMFVLKSLLLFFLAAVLVGEGGLGGYVTVRNVLIFPLKLTLCTSHIVSFFCLSHCVYSLILLVKGYE